MMKIKNITLLVSIVLAVISSVTGFAQAPQALTYQGEARDANGRIIKNQYIELIFSIYNNNYSWDKKYEITTDQYGMFTVILADPSDNGAFAEIPWDTPPVYLNVILEYKGAEISMGETQFMSVPYALSAGSADFNELINKPENVSEFNNDEGYLIAEIDGSISNELNTNVALNGTNLEVTDAGGTKSADLSTLLEAASCELVLDILLHSVDIANLIKAGVPLDDLLNAGHGVGILKQNGASEQDLLDAGLIGFVSDDDGQSYKWVKIGDQIWMAENLAYNAGSGSLAYDDNEDFVEYYGRLYTWEGLVQGSGSSSENPSGIQGVCPSGWHVPSYAEWQELRGFILSNGFTGSTIGNALKATSGWYDGGNGTDDFGFSALPGGRFIDWPSTTEYTGISELGRWWTTDELNPGFGWCYGLRYNHSQFISSNTAREEAASVRCVKD
jgi:uncharacterized protein (TIGR02145 family)